MPAKKLPPIHFITSAYLPSQLKKIHGAVLLFLGRSNVGKSSLLNALCKTQLAKVSKQPGKTRSINYYRWGRFTLVDVPGYGYARRSKQERELWQQLLQAFFDGLASSEIWAYLLIDAQRELEVEEHQLIDACLERAYRLKILLTKCDRLDQSLRLKKRCFIEQVFKQAFPQIEILWTFISTKSGEGIAQLRQEMRP